MLLPEFEPDLEQDWDFLLGNVLVGAKAAPGGVRIRNSGLRCLERENHVAVPVRVGTVVGKRESELGHRIVLSVQYEAQDRDHLESPGQ